MQKMKQIGVGILGFGTVGAGVADGLLKHRDVMAKRLGVDIVLRKIADLDITTDRGIQVPDGVLTTDSKGVLSDPEIDIVVETIGGTGVAKTFVLEALGNGKCVVTANKKLLAEHGREIFETAAKNDVDIYFGASVGGGIPDQEGFQQFRGPGAQLPFRQGLQHFRGQESKHWLDNDPQHILVVVQIDAGLPADGRIDLGKERRRKVGVADAALVDGRGKTGHIRRDAPADRQDEGLSRSARLHQLAANRKDRVHGLVLLRGLDGDCRPRRPRDLPRPWGHFAVIDQIQLPFPRDERKHIPDPFSRFNANFHGN